MDWRQGIAGQVPVEFRAEDLPQRLDEKMDTPWTRKMFGGAVSRLDAMAPFLLWIRDRSGGMGPLLPNAAQRQFARDCGRRNILLKARQLGMTTWIAARFFLETILRPGTVTLQVAHTLESAQHIFRIVRRFLDCLPAPIGRTLETSRETVRELAFASTDSRYILATAGNEHAARGLTVHNLHASEVALWPGDPAETMAALRAAVVPNGRMEMESTPKGTGNFFHCEWLRASLHGAGETHAESGFVPHFFPWWLEPAYRAPVPAGAAVAALSEEEERLMRAVPLDAGQILFRRGLQSNFGGLARQEYAESPSECFLHSGRPVFDLEPIEKRLAEIESQAGPGAVPSQAGRRREVEMWFPPVKGREYIIGADVAEGGGGGDYSAAVLVDAAAGLQCAEVRAQWPLARFAQELAALGRRYNHALLAVECNNHGHAVLYALEHELAYPRLFRQTDGATSRAGWLTTSRSKPEAIAELGKLLRQSPDIFMSERLLTECRNFAYQDGGGMGAPPGGHDDLVMAAAIAYAVRARGAALQVISAGPLRNN